ncbi:MAG: GNAT family N-acetyltransferase [Clostridia bacterium]|nr:GNAT family N-acetyltransferase [Clostridia bacterium]
MVFRKAEKADTAAVMTVIAEARRAIAELGIDQWQDGYPQQFVVEADTEAGIGFVFEDESGILSYTAMTAEPEPIYNQINTWGTEGPYLTVHRVAVCDAARHTGLAAKIIEQAIMKAKAEKLNAIRIDTHPGNVRMRRFLTKRGFTERGIVLYDVLGEQRRVAYDLAIEK